MQLNQQEEIFSMRIVSVDHYMNKPIPELDSWYSEFRGSDIKKVLHTILEPEKQKQYLIVFDNNL